MLKFKRLAFNLGNIINYFYYIKSAFAKNSYPCKLIGEKIEHFNSEPTIIFKVLGKQNAYKVPLNYIFSSKNLISAFSTKDAFHLGKIAFNYVINSPNEIENKEKFRQIKSIMLSSTHDIYQFPNSIFRSEYELEKQFPLDLDIKSVFLNNKYPFKLVGHKNLDTNKTVIIYTIFGKREGYQKSLKEIVSDNSLLKKFHPTEAVKFGFLSAGDNFFSK
jgi:hypothetical protein